MKPLQIRVVNKGRVIAKNKAFIAKKHISTFEVTVQSEFPLTDEQIRQALAKTYQVTGVKFVLRVTVAA